MNSTLPLAAGALALERSRQVAETTFHSRTCLFLDMLPLEMRRMIYRNLVVSQYVQHHLNLKSKEMHESPSRMSILNGPDYSYKFHLSILGANRQIRNEAMDVFERENTFISISHDQPERESYRGWDFERIDNGIPVVAKQKQAAQFLGIVMSIDLVVSGWSPLEISGWPEDRKIFIVTLEDLSAACTSLLLKIDIYNRENFLDGHQKTAIHLAVKLASFPMRVSLEKDPRVKRCLDQLSHIRGAGTAEIQGPISPTYKASVQTALCDRRLSAKEAMSYVEKHSDQGDRLLLKHDLDSAISEYKAALDVLRGNTPTYVDPEEILVEGRFSGVSAHRAFQDSCIRLHATISSAYLRTGQHRLARVYVERIYSPLYSFVNDSWGSRYRTKFPLEIYSDNAVVYAELLAAAAQISLFHGNEPQAVEELKEASRLDQSNLGVAQSLQEVQTRLDSRRELRRQRQENYRDSVKRVFEVNFGIAKQRKTKGDQAFRDDNFEEALQFYEAALKTLQKCQHSLKDAKSTHCSGAHAELTFDILSKLIEWYLEHHDYENVHRWATELIGFERSLSLDTPCYRSDGENFVMQGLYDAYYSKGVAFQKQDKTTAAIFNLGIALSHNPGCHATYYQLEALREIEELNDTRRRIDEERSQQQLLRADKRKEKKVRERQTKKERSWAKKVRGAGYVIGLGSL